MILKQTRKPSEKQVCSIFCPDAEMQDAINELRQAEVMFNNATEQWRMIEASERILAAKARINAIRIERGEEIAKEND